ncbi:hypothetical protein FF011L_18340 [Roseimaritima multifibrata]|uniref:Inner membrane protein YjcH n=1 Tax=Roseimaritima multifibrata TaxID=1930274 RepID=A0A517MDW7_9BACT|nr:DUF485 domain-containing protein [Roseimaritima multifibrata]QDS93079.1 hypothetical protein FF011L_18340 [Roseimaritima multifibrata]
MSKQEPRQYNQRLGWLLFFIYTAMYLGFMLLCAFAPTAMEWRPLGGLNLAILYGFFLIIAALILALIYGFLCRAEGTEE